MWEYFVYFYPIQLPIQTIRLLPKVWIFSGDILLIVTFSVKLVSKTEIITNIFETILEPFVTNLLKSLAYCRHCSYHFILVLSVAGVAYYPFWRHFRISFLINDFLKVANPVPYELITLLHSDVILYIKTQRI